MTRSFVQACLGCHTKFSCCFLSFCLASITTHPFQKPLFRRASSHFGLWCKANCAKYEIHMIYDSDFITWKHSLSVPRRFWISWDSRATSFCPKTWSLSTATRRAAWTWSNMEIESIATGCRREFKSIATGCHCVVPMKANQSLGLEPWNVWESSKIIFHIMFWTGPTATPSRVHIPFSQFLFWKERALWAVQWKCHSNKSFVPPPLAWKSSRNISCSMNQSTILAIVAWCCLKISWNLMKSHRQETRITLERGKPGNMNSKQRLYYKTTYDTVCSMYDIHASIYVYIHIGCTKILIWTYIFIWICNLQIIMFIDAL